MQEKSQRIGSNNRLSSTIIISIVLSWVMAFPFEGQILFAAAASHHLNSYLITTVGVIVHLLGTVAAGFLFHKRSSVKKLFQYTLLLDITTCIVFLFPPSFLWYVLLYPALFFSGCCVAAWAVYYKAYSPVNERIKTAADYLILNNIILLLIGLAVVLVSYQLGLILILILLMAAFCLTFLLPKEEEEIPASGGQSSVSVRKAFLLLTAILLLGALTIGLTYQYILPAYFHLSIITYFYWSIAYIIALFVMRNLPRRINRNYLLSISVALLGFAFIDFMLLGITMTSFFIVCTQIFLARGIFDLFWWSMIGEMLEISENPMKLYGGVLLFYVGGQILGGNLGFYARWHQVELSYPVSTALIAVLIIMIILPPLQKELAILLENRSYLARLSELEPTEQVKLVKKAAVVEKLTERESEIAALLMQGRTYKMISTELYLSENTVKTHIKNIYSKLQVKSKTELIHSLLEHRE